ncbi:hypothetical protein OFB79_24805, partial [Escherichia coli]|nr:hypothetical protein [Escherichia coli]
LLIRAEAGPDDLFFPEMRPVKPVTTSSTTTQSTGNGTEQVAAAVVEGDATYSETIAEVFQDSIAPFRPNISEHYPDQDSEFGKEHQVSLTRNLDFTHTVSAFTR